MNFLDFDELMWRVHRSAQKFGYKGGEPIALHENTRCRVEGFAAVGPLYRGSEGLSWFDLRAAPGTPAHSEVDAMLAKVCSHLGFPYRPFPQEEKKVDEISQAV